MVAGRHWVRDAETVRIQDAGPGSLENAITGAVRGRSRPGRRSERDRLRKAYARVAGRHPGMSDIEEVIERVIRQKELEKTIALMAQRRVEKSIRESREAEMADAALDRLRRGRHYAGWNAAKNTFMRNLVYPVTVALMALATLPEIVTRQVPALKGLLSNQGLSAGEISAVGFVAACSLVMWKCAMGVADHFRVKSNREEIEALKEEVSVLRREVEGKRNPYAQ